MMFKTIRIVMASLLVLVPFLAQAATDHDRSGEQPAADRNKTTMSPPPAIAPGSSLTGIAWRLEELTGEPRPGEQAAPYLLFTNSGDLMGFGGCNYFIGKYHTGDDGSILVSSLRASHQQCPESSERETTLLTSLVMANTWQVSAEGLMFFMSGNNLMKLRAAPDIAVDELMQQGGRLKGHKTRAHKARSKKKKVAAKSTGHGKTATPKIPGKSRPVTKTPAKAH